MQAHETRITVLERQTEEIRTALNELAKDMRRLADAVVQQTEDRAALKRAFEQIERVDKRVDDLRKTLEEMERARLERTAHQAQRELDKTREDRRRFMWMLMGYGMSAGFGAALAHFGIQVLK
ncbi:MAG: hypothetical protein ACP5RV_12015 [Thiomonas sp.]